MATKMSRTECCLTNTVDAQISSASAATGTIQPRFYFGSARWTASAAPQQPMTCMLGQTLVLVSAE